LCYRRYWLVCGESDGIALLRFLAVLGLQQDEERLVRG
jgi:hypothetical protein